MKKATVDLFTRIFSVLAPPPNMTVSQWADKYRRLSSESSAEPGRWRTSKAPYQREIMDAVCDMRVQKVVIMSAAQIGKTDALILNPIGYYMHYDPSPIMVMQPTIQMAETFSKDRLSPMLRDTPVLRDKVNDKSRNSGNTILQKIFPGGHVTMVGANSPSSLASRPMQRANIWIPSRNCSRARSGWSLKRPERPCNIRFLSRWKWQRPFRQARGPRLTVKSCSLRWRT